MAKKALEIPVVTEGTAPIFSADFGALAIDAAGAKMWFFNALKNPISGLTHNDPAVIIALTLPSLDLFIAELMRIRASSLQVRHNHRDREADETGQEAEH